MTCKSLIPFLSEREKGVQEDMKNEFSRFFQIYFLKKILFWYLSIKIEIFEHFKSIIVDFL